MIPSADAVKRKAVPIYSGVVRYFPDALAAVAELSRIGNEQHNPGKPLHWDRSKSGDELDALMRHLMEAGTSDTDGVLHSTKVAWRALANLQKEIEQGVSVTWEREPMPKFTEVPTEDWLAAIAAAKRYRWLRDHCLWGPHDQHRLEWYLPHGRGTGREQLDAHLDAAINATP